MRSSRRIIRTTRTILPLSVLLCLHAIGAVDVSYHPAPSAGDADIQHLIDDLDHDDFSVREKAQRDLIVRGAPIVSLLEARLTQTPTESAEFRERLERVLSAIELASCANLDAAAAEAPAHYIAPDRAVEEKLKTTKVTFEFVNVKLEDALEFLHRRTHVLIWADPSQQEQLVNLRVTDLSADLAFAWVARLCNLETIVRGKVLIVIDAKKAGQLHLQRKRIVLPVPAGYSAWSEAQTYVLVRMLEKAALEPTTVAAGRFTLETCDTAIRNVEHALAGLSSAERASPPRFMSEFQALNASMSKPAPAFQKGGSLETFLQQLEFPCAIDPAVAMTVPSDASAKNMSGFTLVDYLCADLDLAPEIRVNGAVASVQLSPAISVGPYTACGCLLDLRPAFDAGITERQVLEAVQQIVKDSNAYANGAEILGVANGFLFASLDPWTARRAAAFVQDCAAAKKLDGLPPLPMFLRGKVSAVKRAAGLPADLCIHCKAGAPTGIKRAPFTPARPRTSAALAP